MRKATDVFGEWAAKGKDEGMEKNHSRPVKEMIDFVLSNKEEKFSFLDLGCGNGWVLREIAENPLCYRAVGIDGSENMIAKANSLSSDNIVYILDDINFFNFKEKYDFIHSMEVLYYLDNPKEVLEKILTTGLEENGTLIIGIDHYYENTDSHSWQKQVGTRMLMFNELEWVQMFKDVGFHQVSSWRANRHQEWEGTLVITGKKLSVI